MSYWDKNYQNTKNDHSSNVSNVYTKQQSEIYTKKQETQEKQENNQIVKYRMEK